MNKYIFIKNIGKYEKSRVVVWADNIEDAWVILCIKVGGDDGGYLLLNS